MNNFFRMAKICVICAFPMLLMGCWDSQNPENLAYIMTMGIDIDEEAEEVYNFSFAPAKTQTQDVELLRANGNTIAGAVVGIDSKSSRKNDLGQLKIIVVGEEVVAEESRFLALLDELERTQEISEKVMILISEGNAETVLQALMNEEQGLFLWDFFQNTGRNVAITKGLDVDTFLAEYWEQSGCVVVPKIKIVDEKVMLGGGIVLKDGAYNYVMNEQEEHGYLFLHGDGMGAVVEAKQNEFYVPMEVVKQEIEYDIIVKNDNIYFYITCDFDGDLLSNYGSDEAFDLSNKRELEQLLEKEIENNIMKTLDIAIENKNLEALGFGAKARRKYYDLDDNIFDNLEEYSKINLDINVKLGDTGKIR